MLRLTDFTVVLCLLLVVACQKPTDTFEGEQLVPLYPRGTINNFYGAIHQAPDTVFVLAGSEPATVRTARGVILEIEPGAFSRADGSPVDGTLQIAWTDIRRIGQQVRHRLSFDVEDHLLAPKFVCLLEASVQGEALMLSKPLLVKWPDESPAQGLGMWYQFAERLPENDWIVANPATISVSNWIDPLVGAGVTGYLFPLLQTGYWCGAVSESHIPGASYPARATLFPAYDAQNTAVYFLESAKNRAIALRDTGGGVFETPHLPQGSTGRFFCVTEAVRKNFFAAWQDVELQATYDWKPRPERKEIPALVQMLDAM
jgi:hypothetical protein